MEIDTATSKDLSGDDRNFSSLSIYSLFNKLVYSSIKRYNFEIILRSRIIIPFSFKYSISMMYTMLMGSSFDFGDEDKYNYPGSHREMRRTS